MKKILVTTVMIFAVSLSFAQSLFDKFEDAEAVTSVVVSKTMFSLLSKFDVVVEDDPEARDFIAMAKSLESLKVFTTTEKSVAQQMNQEVDQYLKNAKLTELMRIKDPEANVKFYIRAGKDDSHVKELLMFVNGINSDEVRFKLNNQDRTIETVLLSIVGDIDLDKIGSLIAKMNLPSELNKVSE